MPTVLLELSKERGRWALWPPLAFGLGVALYFTLPLEPTLLTLPMICLLSLRLWSRARETKEPALETGLTLGLFMLLLGFGITQYRAYKVEAPVVERCGTYHVEGDILLVEPRVLVVTKRVVLSLFGASAERCFHIMVILGDWLKPSESPKTVRVTL